MATFFALNTMESIVGTMLANHFMYLVNQFPEMISASPFLSVTSHPNSPMLQCPLMQDYNEVKLAGIFQEINTVKQRITMFSLCFCVLFSINANAAVIFKDSFESSDMSTTSSDGFKWDSNNGTSIVTMNASCSTPGTPVAIYNNRVICNVHDPRDWGPRTGNNSLRFRYAAGVNWSEQRFDAGGAYPELWVGYWIRVPTNYYRGNGTNNKWFDILMGNMSDYENSNVSRIEMQDWPGDAGKGDINIQFRNGTDGKFKNSARYKGFLDPADAGRWMHIVYHLKSSSSPTSTDGIIRMYRKWEGSSSYDLINELVNLNVGITSYGRKGWSGGYLMGYYNAPFAQDTEWLLDDFTLSTTSLISNLAPPRPPTIQ